MQRDDRQTISVLAHSVNLSNFISHFEHIIPLSSIYVICNTGVYCERGRENVSESEKEKLKTSKQKIETRNGRE